MIDPSSSSASLTAAMVRKPERRGADEPLVRPRLSPPWKADLRLFGAAYLGGFLFFLLILA